jgi:hypothetical protein
MAGLYCDHVTPSIHRHARRRLTAQLLLLLPRRGALRLRGLLVLDAGGGVGQLGLGGGGDGSSLVGGGESR